MFSLKQMNEWRDKIHGLAIEKGWYNEERSRLSLVMLINSEVFEAYECWRKKEDITRYNEAGKPYGLPSELADVVIRLFDMAGYYKVDFNSPPMRLWREPWVNYKCFEEFCSNVANDMFDWQHGDFLDREEYIHTIDYIHLYCTNNNIDLEKEIMTKHEFNKTRSNRHGGKRS